MKRRRARDENKSIQVSWGLPNACVSEAISAAKLLYLDKSFSPNCVTLLISSSPQYSVKGAGGREREKLFLLLLLSTGLLGSAREREREKAISDYTNGFCRVFLSPSLTHLRNQFEITISRNSIREPIRETIRETKIRETQFEKPIRETIRET